MICKKTCDHFANYITNLKVLVINAILISVFIFSMSMAWGQSSFLVTPGATWKYLDDGSNQGMLWQSLAFDDSGWLEGPAELGYGDGDEATVVSFGGNPSNKHVTTYFRHLFNIPDVSIFSNLLLRIIRDDGAVVYLNGTEVFRTNMPAGGIAYTTLASSVVGGVDEMFFNETSIDPSLLVNGDNVIAVEIHQFNISSSDISFDLGLCTDCLARGPYLQMSTPTSIVVRWRTADDTDSRVTYGTDLGNLNTVSDDATLTTEHEITLSSLNANTKYYYSVGTTMGPIAGGNNNHFFYTSPLVGTSKPTRVWVIGDSGTADVNAQAVRDAYLEFTETRNTDVWLMLGDNAYIFGTDLEYQAAVFDMYPMLLRNTVVWPTFGNHDALSASSFDQSGPYYDIFTLPRFAEAGGLASGTEAYYSFDYGNIHFICLNSMDIDRSPGESMLIWLQNDLNSTNQEWIIAYWHHPPYSDGSHDSNQELELIEMRENALPILEASGVDLVLTGHSHTYERSWMIDGYYFTPTDIGDGTIMDSGDGRLNSDGAYSKPSSDQASNEGTVYSVVGCSGLHDIGAGSLNHPLMYISLDTLGSMVLDIDGDQLDARFIDNNGSVLDYFTLVKGRPVCDIQMSQESYTAGDIVTASVFRISNPDIDSVSVELAVWLKVPAISPISFVNVGADGSVVFPSGFDQDYGPLPLFPAAGLPPGNYEFSCRLLDPITKKLLAEDLNTFQIQ